MANKLFKNCMNATQFVDQNVKILGLGRHWFPFFLANRASSCPSNQPNFTDKCVELKLHQILHMHDVCMNNFANGANFCAGVLTPNYH